MAALSRSIIDRSGTLTTGGTPQELMPANRSRTSWEIANPGSETLWYAFHNSPAADTEGSFPIDPHGRAWSKPVCETDTIWWVAATTGAPITAVETS